MSFACDGTIALGAAITIDSDTVIDGNGHQITVSGGHLARVFEVADNVSLTLINLSIANGLSTNGYGGGIYNSGRLNAMNCRFVANRVQGVQGASGIGGDGYPGGDGCGGAVYNSGMMNFSDCSFALNSALGGDGGAAGDSVPYEPIYKGGVGSGKWRRNL